jgi:hypothetical protein
MVMSMMPPSPAHTVDSACIATRAIGAAVPRANGRFPQRSFGRRLLVLATASFFLSGAVAASEHRVVFDAALGMVSVNAPDGTQMMTDLASRESTIIVPGRAPIVVAYDALDASAKRSVDELVFAASNPESGFVMRYSGQSTPNPYSDFSPLIGQASFNNALAFSSSGCFSMYDDCHGNPRPNQPGSGDSGVGGGGWEGSGGGSRPVTQADLERYDKDRWQSEKDKACRTRDLALLGVAGSAAVATVGCALAFSPAVVTAAPVVACVGGLIALGASGMTAYDAHQACKVETYPGMGNW